MLLFLAGHVLSPNSAWGMGKSDAGPSTGVCELRDGTGPPNLTLAVEEVDSVGRLPCLGFSIFTLYTEWI